MEYKKMRDVHIIEMEIEDLEAKIRVLKHEKLLSFKALRRTQLDDDMVDLLTIIIQNPGIDKARLLEMSTVSEWDYNNKMTSLRRRGAIINLGVRRSPQWYPTFGRNK